MLYDPTSHQIPHVAQDDRPAEAGATVWCARLFHVLTSGRTSPSILPGWNLRGSNGLLIFAWPSSGPVRGMAFRREP